MARRRRALLSTTAALLVAVAGCAPVDPDDGTLDVYATTGYLADAVANIAPDANVTTMVGPGGDPHTHQPSTRDIEAILDADLVLWNGLQLEAQMADQLQSLGDRQLAVGDGLPAELLLDWSETDAGGEPLHDPHIWNSPEAWSLVVADIARTLAELDPAGADAYAANAAEYRARIDEAADEAAALLDAIPEPRILITGHDAFGYFGETFGLTVLATDFVSTDAALSPQALSSLAALIAEHEVPVIFHDNQANPQAITSLQEAVRALGGEVEVSADELYADSLGVEPGVDTYLGVFLHNARAVAAALGTEAP